MNSGVYQCYPLYSQAVDNFLAKCLGLYIKKLDYYLL